jgi:hypothetical protein
VHAFSCFQIRAKVCRDYARTATFNPEPLADGPDLSGTYRYGQILYFAKVVLGDGSELEVARVNIFIPNIPNRDPVHEMALVSNKADPLVPWVRVADIGEPVIFHGQHGTAREGIQGPWVVLGGSRVWQPSPVPPAPDWDWDSSDELEASDLSSDTSSGSEPPSSDDDDSMSDDSSECDDPDEFF